MRQAVNDVDVPAPPQADRFWIRLLLLVAAIPFFYVLIFLVPGYRYLLFSSCAVVGAVLGSREVAGLFAHRKVAGDWWLAGLSAGAFPVVAYLENWDLLPANALGVLVTAVVVSVLVVAVVRANRSRTLAQVLEHASATLFAGCYPGLFIGYIVRLVGVGDPRWMLLTFFVAVFANDTSAYVAGKLARGRTAIGLPVSPAKTAIGFAAGIMASVGALIVAHRLFPGAPRFGTIEAAVGGAAIGVCAVVGDLIESALKRAARVKDSGKIIPGRGGLLDSIDSLLLCAPLFFFWMRSVEWT
jgi:phosphatidate cytidylyltransferase